MKPIYIEQYFEQYINEYIDENIEELDVVCYDNKKHKYIDFTKFHKLKKLTLFGYLFINDTIIFNKELEILILNYDYPYIDISHIKNLKEFALLSDRLNNNLDIIFNENIEKLVLISEDRSYILTDNLIKKINKLEKLKFLVLQGFYQNKLNIYNNNIITLFLKYFIIKNININKLINLSNLYMEGSTDLEYIDLPNKQIKIIYKTPVRYDMIDYIDGYDSIKKEYIDFYVAENNTIYKQKIIKRRRIYLMNEVYKGRKFNENQQKETNQITYNINIRLCKKCNKYINKDKLINIRKYINKYERYNTREYINKINLLFCC